MQISKEELRQCVIKNDTKRLKQILDAFGIETEETKLFTDGKRQLLCTLLTYASVCAKKGTLKEEFANELIKRVGFLVELGPHGELVRCTVGERGQIRKIAIEPEPHFLESQQKRHAVVNRGDVPVRFGGHDRAALVIANAGEQQRRAFRIVEPVRSLDLATRPTRAHGLRLMRLEERRCRDDAPAVADQVAPHARTR